MAFVASGGLKQPIKPLLRFGDSQLSYAMAQQQTDRPQSHHFAPSEDTKASTHDFLSLYDKGPPHAENGSSAGLPSSALTTHDFLQPLERNGVRRDVGFREKHSGRGDGALQSRLNSTPVLPNYAPIQLPYVVPSSSLIRMAGEHRSGRAYPLATLSSREDHGGVDPVVESDAASRREGLAYWPGAGFKFGLPTDMAFAGGTPVVKAGVENGHQSTPAVGKQWVESPKQRPARPPSEDEDDDEDSSERPKGERIESKGDAAQRLDVKNAEMRGGTPRSKHSATEQRRRSKINDRFQMLRDLVPHSDQKRDKASFLLEVIDYVQVLQEKVQKFETAEQARHQERLKSMVWDLCKREAAGSGDETSALVFAKDVGSGGDVKAVAEGEIRAPRPSEQAAPVSEAHSTGGFNAQHGPSRPSCSLHSCVSSLDGEKESALTAQPLAMSMALRQAIPLPYALPIAVPSAPDHQFEVRPRFSSATTPADQQSKPERQTVAATFIGRIDGAQASASRQPHGAPQLHENASKNARHHSAPTDGSAASPAPSQPFPRIQGGVINVSSVYSQGLLDTLTRALQSSGVDLSQANISVQIDLGKNASVAAADTSAKVATTPESSAQSHQSQGRTRPSPPATEPEPSLKRPKLETHE